MAKDDKNQNNVHHKHRQRVFYEIEQTGLDVLSEHRVLEYLLFFCIPRKDTNEIAHALINKFGNFSAVLEASEADLQTVDGIGPAAAKFLHAMPALTQYYAVNKAKEDNNFEFTEERVKYILPLFRSKKKETFYMLIFNARGKMVKSILLEEGTAQSVNVDVKKVASLAMQAGAASVILAHNHPGGVALPSQNDITATANIMRALGVLQISVRDHIIVSGEDYYSMKDNGQMPFYNMKTHELRFFT